MLLGQTLPNLAWFERGEVSQTGTPRTIVFYGRHILDGSMGENTCVQVVKSSHNQKQKTFHQGGPHASTYSNCILCIELIKLCYLRIENIPMILPYGIRQWG